MHKNDLRLTALLCGVVAALAAGSASAGLQDGLRAVERNDFKAAVKAFEEGVPKDDAECLYQLGRLYFYGLGSTKPQRLTGIGWWERAALLGHVGSQLELGKVFREGLGVRPEARQGFVWDKKAADQGSSAGMKAVGDYYRNGWSKEKDLKAAAKWYRRSAEKGDPAGLMAWPKLLVDPETGEAPDRVSAYVLIQAAEKPAEGFTPDRNAAADARNLKAEMSQKDLEHAAKTTVADVLHRYSRLEDYQEE